MGWLPKGYSFVAKGSSTTITFTNTTALSPFGPALDDIVVTETAATGSEVQEQQAGRRCSTAVGDSFKNQGDCVSFYATDGNNLGGRRRPAPLAAQQLRLIPRPPPVRKQRGPFPYPP